jgi:hypothetical protein
MKTAKTAKKMPDKQLATFRKAARDLGCDDNEERFKSALRTVAKAKPKTKKPSGTRRA